MVPPSTILPPSQSSFSLEYKQNIGRKMEFRREVWYSSNRNLFCQSYALSFIMTAKYIDRNVDIKQERIYRGNAHPT
jgi:hypothetical protein